jgi:DNA polymerase-3 subunit epsilon
MSDIAGMALEEHAAALAAHPGYRVLRRVEPPIEYTPADQLRAPLTAIYVDVETTGLDVAQDVIIQLAAVKFSFDSVTGAIGRVLDVFEGLEDPGGPLPKEIVKLTGLTDTQLVGQRLDEQRFAHFVADSQSQEVPLFIAHHADFDRKMIERRFSWLGRYPWACSEREVPWKDYGARSTKLCYLAEELLHEFYEGHAAMADALAGVHLLARAQLDGTPAMRHLLDSARRPTVRLWAVDAAYSKRHILKQRGYRWGSGEEYKGQPKAWYIDIFDDAYGDELAWLAANVYPARECQARSQRVTAWNRYSVRV